MKLLKKKFEARGVTLSYFKTRYEATAIKRYGTSIKINI